MPNGPLSCAEVPATERPVYISGHMLDADTLTLEQEYFLDRHRTHNRLLHGAGVVCGLAVEPIEPPSTAVRVTPGVAIDSCGREIVLTEPVQLDLRVTATTGPSATVYVVIEYGELPVAATPAFGSDPQDVSPSRVREVPVLRVLSHEPAERPSALGPAAAGLFPCPKPVASGVLLAAVHTPPSGPITAERIDNRCRVTMGANQHRRDDSQRSQEFAEMQRRFKTLTVAVAALGIGFVASLLRR